MVFHFYYYYYCYSCFGYFMRSIYFVDTVYIVLCMYGHRNMSKNITMIILLSYTYSEHKYKCLSDWYTGYTGYTATVWEAMR